MTANRLEEKTQQFWEASLACRGFTPYVDGQTFASMIVRLEPLRYQGEFHKIRNHAEELIDMLVHDRQERILVPASQADIIVATFKKAIEGRGRDNNPCSEIILDSCIR